MRVVCVRHAAPRFVCCAYRMLRSLPQQQRLLPLLAPRRLRRLQPLRHLPPPRLRLCSIDGTLLSARLQRVDLAKQRL